MSRRATFRQWATILFVLTIVCLLLAIWLWSRQWALTGGVFLMAAWILGLIGADL